MSFILFFSMNCEAELNIAALKKRQAGFEAWQRNEVLRQEKINSDIKKVKSKREAHIEKQIKARESFKRVVRSRKQFEAAFLAKEQKREQAQELSRSKFAQKQKVLEDYYEKHLLPLKAREYDLTKEGARE